MNAEDRRVLVLHVTDRCNIGCHYCYAGKSLDSMPLPVAEKAVDWFAGFAGDPSKASVIFIGGEPLMAPKLLDEVVALAKRRGITNFGIATNGYLLDDEWLGFLADHRFYVHLSLDGTQEAHDRNRPLLGGGGTFDRIEKALDALPEYAPRLQHVELRHTFTPETAGLLAESLRFYSGKEIIRWSWVALMPAMLPVGRWEAALSRGAAAVLRAQLAEIADLCLETEAAGRPLQVTYNDCLVEAPPLLQAAREERLGKFSCDSGTKYVTVNMAGDIFPCHLPGSAASFADNASFKLGTVFEGLTAPEKAAVFCGAPFNEHHSCPHWNRLETGDAARPAPVYTALYAAWLEAVRRIRRAREAAAR
jgi:uncharacterized protein